MYSIYKSQVQSNNKTTPINSNPVNQDVLVTQDINNTEFIYYEANVFNNTYLEYTNVDANPNLRDLGNRGIDIPAQYSEQRRTPILYRTSEYKVAVSSFSLPTSSIPLFILRNEESSGVNKDGDIIYPYRYTITMLADIDGITYKGNDYVFRNSLYTDGYNVREISVVIQAINMCFTRVFNGMVAAWNNAIPPGMDSWEDYNDRPQYPPFIVYDNGYVEIYNDIRMCNPRMSLIFSNNLAQMLRGVGYFSRNSFSFYGKLDIEIKPGGSNVKELPYYAPGSLEPDDNVTYVFNRSESDISGAFYQYKKLYLISNLIGIKSTDIGVNKPINSTNGIDLTSNIVASYNITIDSSISNNSSTNLLYVPNFLVWNDLFKDDPLYTIDLKWRLGNEEGDLIDLVMENDSNFSVKLVFARKFF